MSRPFDGYGNYVHLTKEEVKAMQDEFARYEPARWRDGAAIYSHGLIGEPTFQGTIKKDCWTKVKERRRMYQYANGVSTSVEGIEWVWVSSTGTHYLKTNSHIHIMKKDWVQIAITE